MGKAARDCTFLRHARFALSILFQIKQKQRTLIIGGGHTQEVIDDGGKNEGPTNGWNSIEHTAKFVFPHKNIPSQGTSRLHILLTGRQTDTDSHRQVNGYFLTLQLESFQS